MGMESCVSTVSKSNDGTVDSISSPTSSRRRRHSRRAKGGNMLNSAQFDSSAAPVSLASTSQRVDAPQTNTHVRGFRPSAPLADVHKAQGTIIASKPPAAHSGERVKEMTTEFDDKSYEAPLKDHSANQGPCLRKSSANKARTLRAQREQTARREQQDTDMKVDRKHKKGRETESRLFYELQIPGRCDTPVSALSMDDLEGWFESLHQESCLGIRTATTNPQDAAPVDLATGVTEVRGVPSTIHSIHDNAPLSGISMDNEEWMEELFEESCLHETCSMDRSTHVNDSEVLARGNPFTVGNRLQCPPSKEDAVSPERSRFKHGSGRACSQRIPLACGTAAVEKRSDRDKLNLKKPSLDTVVAFLISPEWEDHQRILSDWRAFVDIRRPVRDTSKECSASEVRSPQDQRGARTPKDDFPMRRSQSMRIFPIFETAMPECDELSADQPALDPREVVQRKKMLQRVHPIGRKKGRDLKLRKGQ